ncbi:MAG: glycosyltransferase family 2 protein, partial [Bdellovibrionales bacterium]|nr:glycosyltransferase family 2 protein [Bdellovibrionales bacterium]
MSFTVFISSNGHFSALRKCLESLEVQTCYPDRICIGISESLYVQMDQFLQRSFRDSKIFAILKCVSLPTVPNGRNWALRHVESPFLLFLDEGVVLPKPNHLELRERYHRALPNIQLLGGPYINLDFQSGFERAHNDVANLWMQRYQKSYPRCSPQDFLVTG